MTASQFIYPSCLLTVLALQTTLSWTFLQLVDKKAVIYIGMEHMDHKTLYASLVLLGNIRMFPNEALSRASVF